MLQLLTASHATCPSCAVNISPSCTGQKQFTIIPLVERCVKLTNESIIWKWKDDTLSLNPKNIGEKRKDLENIIMITITIIIMTVTMTMTEIVDLEAGINHTTEIDHIIEIVHKTTMKMIIEMITEITIEMTI